MKFCGGYTEPPRLDAAEERRVLGRVAELLDPDAPSVFRELRDRRHGPS